MMPQEPPDRIQQSAQPYYDIQVVRVREGFCAVLKRGGMTIWTSPFVASSGAATALALVEIGALQTAERVEATRRARRN